MKTLKIYLLCIIGMLCSASVWAYDFFEVDGVSYHYDPYGYKVVLESHYPRYSGNFVIPDSVVYKGVTYPVTEIGSQAFRDCENLTSVKISSNIKRIGNWAFKDCTKLSEIYIPKNVSWIDSWAFDGCCNIKSIVVSSENCFYDSRNNCNAIIDKKNKRLVIGCQRTKIPLDITTIASKSFAGCSNLKAITIPSNITTIDLYAFKNCTSLNEIFIPDKVNEIDFPAFEGCKSLKKITVDVNNKSYSSPENCNAIINNATNELVLGCKNTTILPNVTSIGEYAFSGNGLDSLAIPSNVKIIKKHAFSSCENLVSVKLPKTLEEIQQAAFWGCSSLEKILIPNSVKIIGSSTFSKCHKLKYVKISEQLREIEHYTFSDCFSLDTIDCTKSILSIAHSAFARCTNLNCVRLPENLISIGDRVFEECTNLHSLDIPASVQSLGNDVFKKCQNMDTLFVNAITPPNVTQTTFQSLFEGTVLQVPDKCKDIYQQTDIWNAFLTIVESDKIPFVRIVDSESQYDRVRDKKCTKLEYVRSYTNTSWQALYVPFGMAYADWSNDFEIARINDTHQYDDNNDGTIDRTILEVFILPEGSNTKANTPYLIKAKTTGEKILCASDVLLKKSENAFIDCSSVDYRYVITGTYTGVSGDDMFNNKYYALSDGGLKQASQPTPLGAFRWYLFVEDRSGKDVVAPQSIKLRIVDENGNVTGVEDLDLSVPSIWPANIYNMQGKLVKTNAYGLDNLPKGVYVVNGKKIIK